MNLLRFFLFSFLIVFLLGLIIFRALPEFFNGKSPKPELAVFGFFILITLVVFLFARDEYYYYEFDNRSLTVKSLLKKYYRYQFDYCQIIKVTFNTYIDHGITITYYEEGFTRTKEFTSYNLSKSEWQDFRKTLEELNILYEKFRV